MQHVHHNNHHAAKRSDFAASNAGRIRRDTRRAAIATKRLFLILETEAR